VPTYTLTVSVTGSGSVSGSGISCPGTCSGTYTAGTPVALSATPASGFTFTGWTGACSGTGACNVTMSSNQTVGATFTKIPPPPPPKCSVHIKSRKVWLAQPHKRPGHKVQKVSVGTVPVTVQCNQAATVKLTGVLVEVIGKGKHGKLITKTFRLKAITVSVRPNAPMVLLVKLPKLAFAGLKAHKAETIKFTLSGSNANGVSVSSTRKVTLQTH
jgi:uncharacterized repeat protein (TIGR02543 family)